MAAAAASREDFCSCAGVALGSVNSFPQRAPQEGEPGVDFHWSLESLFKGVLSSDDDTTPDDALVSFPRPSADTPWRSIDIFMEVLPSLSPLPSLCGVSLVQLSLCYCCVSSLAGVEQLTSLRRVWLSHNEITDIRPFGSLPHLQRLFVSDNDLSGMAEFSSQSLEVLDISCCKISNPPDLSRCASLRSLDISRNPIGRLPALPRTLVHLNAACTALMQLPLRRLAALPELKSLTLSDSPSGGPAPAATSAHYKMTVLARLPQLRILDTNPVSAEELKASQLAFNRKSVFYDSQARFALAQAHEKIKALQVLVSGIARQRLLPWLQAPSINAKACGLLAASSVAEVALCAAHVLHLYASWMVDAGMAELASAGSVRFAELTGDPLRPPSPDSAPLEELVASRCEEKARLLMGFSISHDGAQHAVSAAAGHLIEATLSQPDSRVWPLPSPSYVLGFLLLTPEQMKSLSTVSPMIVAASAFCMVPGQLRFSSNVAPIASGDVSVAIVARILVDSSVHVERTGQTTIYSLTPGITRATPIAVIAYTTESGIVSSCDGSSDQVSWLEHAIRTHIESVLAALPDPASFTQQNGEQAASGPLAVLPPDTRVLTLTDPALSLPPGLEAPALTCLSLAGTAVADCAALDPIARSAPELSTIIVAGTPLGEDLAEQYTFCASPTLTIGGRAFVSHMGLVLVSAQGTLPPQASSCDKCLRSRLLTLSECVCLSSAVASAALSQQMQVSRALLPDLARELATHAVSFTLAPPALATLVHQSPAAPCQGPVTPDSALSCVFDGLDLSGASDLPAMPRAQQVRLAGCRLTDSSPLLSIIGALAPAATEIVLSHNFITQVGLATLVRSLTRTPVRILVLEDNCISALPDDVFAQLPRLSVLDLSHNPLETLGDGLRGCRRLSELFLFGTRLTAATAPAPVQQMFGIVSSRAQGSRPGDVVRAELALLGLASIDTLSVLGLTPLTPRLRLMVISRARQLQLLNNCTLGPADRREAEHAFGGRLEYVAVQQALSDTGVAPEAIQELSFSDSRLTSLYGLSAYLILHPAAFAHLRKLSVARNELVSLATLPGFPRLAVLDASSNAIAGLSSTAGDSTVCPAMPSLVWCSLAANRLTTPSCSALSVLAPHLTELYLSDNQIDSLAGLRLPNLRLLHASQNPLRTVKAGDLGGMPQLQELVLSSCGLRLCTGISCLQYLRVLDISNNLLSRPADVVMTAQEGTKLESFDTSGNPASRRRGLRAAILAVCPQLKTLDRAPVSAAEVSQARASHASAVGLNPVSAEPVRSLKPSQVTLSL